MTVHFIGAGPGAPDLITVRGLRLIEKCPVCLYAGSLVPVEIIKAAPKNAHIVDTASMHLDEILTEMESADKAGLDIARVHSGDPSLYGAIAEQMRRLDMLGIAYDITPGVSAYAAAAASLKQEFTLPGISQSLILTRTAIRASAMPEREDLTTLGASGATLAIHLSINNLAKVVRELTPLYGPDCPVIIGYRISWPDEMILRGTLATIRPHVKAAGFTRTALILVGRVLDPNLLHNPDFMETALYDADHSHVLRDAHPIQSKQDKKGKVKTSCE